MQAAKDGVCLLEPPFGLLRVKSEQLDQNVRGLDVTVVVVVVSIGVTRVAVEN